MAQTLRPTVGYRDPRVRPPVQLQQPTLMGYIDPNPQPVREEALPLGAPLDEAPAPEVEAATPPPAPKRERRSPLRRMARKLTTKPAPVPDVAEVPQDKPRPPINKFAAFNVGAENVPHVLDKDL